MARVWTCRRCRKQNKRTTQLCVCGTRRPKPRPPAHRKVLDTMPYEEWVEKYGGEQCGICGRPPSEKRRLDRDHCHASGRDRGLLCPTCNRSLKRHMDVAWLEAAAAYLRRSAPQ